MKGIERIDLNETDPMYIMIYRIRTLKPDNKSSNYDCIHSKTPTEIPTQNPNIYYLIIIFYWEKQQSKMCN